MLIALQDKNVKMSVIASKSLLLKGKGSLPEYSNMEGIHIHRLYRNNYDIFVFPRRKLKKALDIARDLKPDLIFSSGELNMRLALLLQKSLKVPIVLLVEDAGILDSGEMHSSIKMKSVMQLLRLPTGPSFWNWLCKKASAIITCHPRDIANLEKLSRYGKPIYYAPWPTYIPPNLNSSIKRHKFRGVYVGSLEPFKNTQEFEHTLPRVLKETQTKEFIVVGPGAHAKIIINLQKETKGSIRYIPELPRGQALELIASSYYAYTPVIKGGWGFIGDCWSMGTPVIMTHSDDRYVTNNVNALVSQNENGLTASINQLYTNPELFRELQQNGYSASKAKDTNEASNSLYNVFVKTLKSKPSNQASNSKGT
jgi:glycosyltransferase involved in cell wall biosynthesis